MSEKIKQIDEKMVTMIEDVVKEQLFKYLEQNDLIDMMNKEFENIHSKIDLLIGQPRMFNQLIDMDDDTKHDVEEAFDLFDQRDDGRADGRAHLARNVLDHVLGHRLADRRGRRPPRLRASCRRPHR